MVRAGARSAPRQSSWSASSLRFSQWQAVDQGTLGWSRGGATICCRVGCLAGRGLERM